MARGRIWVKDPDKGGKNIPPAVRTRVAERIRRYADEHHAGKFTRLDIRFRGAFCYVDIYTEPDEPSPDFLKVSGETREQYLERLRASPLHLFRLRYFGNEEEWAVAFFLYSHERYELSMLPNGSFYGTPEEVFEVSTTFLP